MKPTVNFKAKRARLIRQSAKIRAKAKAEKSKRIAEAKAKEAAIRINNKRNRMVAHTKKTLTEFEKALTRLESDHIALKRFRTERYYQLVEKIAKAERDLNVLFRMHDNPVRPGENRPERDPRKEHNLEEKLRALKLELKLIEHLR